MSPSRRLPDGRMVCESCPDVEPMTEQEAWHHLQTAHPELAHLAGSLVERTELLPLDGTPKKRGGKRRRHGKNRKHKRG